MLKVLVLILILFFAYLSNIDIKCNGDIMKKILLLFLSLFLFGCSNKLTCTYKEKYEDVTIKNKIIFDFKKNTCKQVDKMIFKDKSTASKYYEDISEYIDEYNLVLKNNIISSNLLDTIKLDGDKKTLKEQYENYGYKCK